MIGLLYLIAAVAGAALMLNFQIGPFAHPRFSHHSTRFMQLDESYRQIIISASWIALMTAVSHLLGLWSF